MNGMLRLLVGTVIVSLPVLAVQLLAPNWLPEAGHQLLCLGESRTRIVVESARHTQLREAMLNVTARIEAKTYFVTSLLADPRPLTDIGRQFRGVDLTFPDPSCPVGAFECPGDSEEQRYAHQVVAVAQQVLRDQGDEAEKVLARLRCELRQLLER